MLVRRRSNRIAICREDSVRISINRIAAAFLSLAAISSAQAQFITYDAGARNLNIPSVQVGTDVYVNVVLVNTHGDFVFTVTAATLQVPPQPAVANYDPATGVAQLPIVVAGDNFYTNVKLQLQADGTLKLNGFDDPANSATSAACFAPLFLTTGTTWDLKYQTTGANPATYANVIDALGAQTFNGQSAIGVRSNVTYVTGTGGNSVTTSYVQVQFPDVTTLGTSADTIRTSGVPPQTYHVTTTTTFAPALIFRYSLNAGDTVSSSFTATAVIISALPGTWNCSGTPDPNKSCSTNTYTGSDQYSFEGFEDVTVPAGTFTKACRWLYRAQRGVSTLAPVRQWISRKGALLRTETNYSNGSVDVTELTSGTVNGVPLPP
jgi:hypothetical protein